MADFGEKGRNLEEDEPRQKKLEEMQQAYLRQKDAEQKQLEAEMKAQAILRRMLDDKALERMNNVKLVNRELYSNAFNALVSMAQKGYLEGKADDSQLKQILYRLRPEKEITIKRK
ncbi:DNA-binding protein [uncultured archaeon]|nr:DNA-binding protein [uncultured archaeon]